MGDAELSYTLKTATYGTILEGQQPVEKLETKEGTPWDMPSGAGVLWALVALVSGSLLVGALLAPQVHTGLVALGRAVAEWSFLRDLSFERVASRCVLVSIAVGFLPSMRRAGARNLADLGLVRERGWPWRIGLWAFLGMGSILLVLAGGWVLGAYVPSNRIGVRDLFSVAMFAWGALFVGIIEEIFFRGALYGGIRKVFGPFVGMLVSSLLFSIVHFAKPVPQIGIAKAHWYSGLQLVPDTFRIIHASYHYFPYALTLLLMGIVLCVAVERTGSLFAAIGLHTGWIWAMRATQSFLSSNEGKLETFFGRGGDLATGYVATFTMAGILVKMLILWRPSRRSSG